MENTQNKLTDAFLDLVNGGVQNRPSTGRCDFCGAEVQLQYDDSHAHGTEMSYRCPSCGRFSSELLG